MKKLTCVMFVHALMTLGALSAGAGENECLLVSAHGTAPHRIQIGFSDSSFDYPRVGPGPESKTYCYSGNVNEVCNSISRVAAEMAKRYRGGAHDTMDLKACSVQTSPNGTLHVVAIYHLQDDYGGSWDVNRKIYPCFTAPVDSSSASGFIDHS